MAQISAALVKQLRDKTQMPMMECKKALTEAQGDVKQAEEILRKSGAMAAASKAGRETAEGRIAAHALDGQQTVAMVEIRCETAPVANTDDFDTMCHEIARHVASSQEVAADVETLLDQPLAFEPSRTVRDLMNDTINKIRENMQIVRFIRLTGSMVASYEHHNGQVAATVQLTGDTQLQPDDDLTRFARDLCMHVAAVSPLALDRDSVPSDLVEAEQQVIQSQVAEQAANKPPAIVEKIVTGKLNKWYNERVLLEQPFVKDDKKSVSQFVSEFAKGYGKPVKIENYVRYEVGGAQ